MIGAGPSQLVYQLSPTLYVFGARTRGDRLRRASGRDPSAEVMTTTQRRESTELDSHEALPNPAVEVPPGGSSKMIPVQDAAVLSLKLTGPGNEQP